MKLKSTHKRTFLLAMAAGISTLGYQQSFASIRPLPVSLIKVLLTEEEKPEAKNKTSRNFAKLNNDAVKIYPDAIKRSMHVVAKENEGKKTDFYVFDLEGTLLKHFKMQPRDHQQIKGLKRGTYIYRVFTGDEETASGKINIR